MIESALTVTHQIISLTRGATRGSSSPMWRCETLDSQRVNVFMHVDPARNSFKLFYLAGYAEEMQALAMNQKQRWTQYPIDVTLRKNGDWWEVVAVAPRPAGACPDPANVPDADLYRRAAQRWAESLLILNTTVVIWDSETTGTTDQDEIITLSAIDTYGEILLKLKLRPRDLSAVARATEIHGLTPDDLADAPTFPQMYKDIRSVLGGRIWCIYNAPFDMKRLDYMCQLYHCEPIRPAAVVDAMQLAAEFIGQWDYEKDGFAWPRLTAAAEQLGVTVKDAHDALGDCFMTRNLIEAMADWQPPAESEA